MSFIKSSASAIGNLLTVIALAGTFLVGAIGVVYLSLKGEEIKIPKVVGKNFNEGKDELSSNGLRIRKVASRYSTEDPNTILEQRPRAGTVGKTGLMISVIVSESNPDGDEAPVKLQEDDDEAEEIKELPELETDKSKKKNKSKKKKESSKTRDVIKKKTKKKDDKKSEDTKENEGKKDGSDKKTGNDKGKPGKDGKKDIKGKPETTKPKTNTTKPKKDTKKPKTSGGTRARKVQKSN